MSANAYQAQCPPPFTPFTPVIPAVPHSWTLPAEDVSAGKARRRVAAALPQLVPWRQRRPDLGERLALVASELVTNAVRYGRQPGGEDGVVEMTLWRADGYLWLAVADAGDGKVPVGSCPGPDGCDGRGLLLVDAVCDVRVVLPRAVAGKSVVAGFWLHRVAA
jgi:anti-sigma regulatory factor (Ser/Thr protein kinase)